MLFLTPMLLILVVQMSWIPPGTAKFHKDIEIFRPALSEKSNFGFSATYQPDIKRLIVSAPTANNIGEIYSCDIDKRDCDKININITRVNDTYTHNYWLGATVKAGPDYFLTCAPMSIKREYYSMYGTFATCLKVTSNNYTTLPTISRYRRNRYTEASIEQKMDSFGWSIDIAKNDNYTFGGPGMFSGRAMTVNGEDLKENADVESLVGIQYNVRHNFGYSVAYGYFYSNNNSIEYEDLAIGSPYGEIGSGKVKIFSSTRVVLQELKEEFGSVGSMFGAVLCSARLKANTDALFIGAPLHAQAQDFDVGAVYVYQKSNNVLKLLRTIKGQRNGGQFGSAIANIGDINGDKINDIAISAPYENDSKGAVYLYCGASIAEAVVNLTPLQRIEASGVMNFGKSLAVLADYDENGCNELAIGAPGGNGSVVLYKGITEISINLEARFPSLKKRTDITRFFFKSCFTVSYPVVLKHVDGHVKISLQLSHEQAKLAHPGKDSEYTVPLLITQTDYCREVEVSTPPGNYNHEISYQMDATLVENPESLPYDPSRVMFSDRSVLTNKGSVRAAECIGDNDCVPNILVTITPSKNLAGAQPYTIGSSVIESFTISLNNSGDTAYEMCIIVRLEGTVANQMPKGCTNVKNQLKCEPPHALRNNKPWTLAPVDIKMDQLTSKNRDITIHVDLFHDCNNQTQRHENSKSLTVPLTSSTDFAIKGYTDIDNIVNMTNEEIKFFGKDITHIYSIANNGPTNWVGLQYTLTFKKEPYIDETVESSYVTFVRISSDTDITCHVEASAKPDEAKVTCNIGMVYGKSQKQLIVPINILPGKLDSLLGGVKLPVVTHCSLFNNLNANITTTLTEGKKPVPLWILFAACFVGVLIILVLVLILIECGCMRRKNKEKLQALRKDVRRQTIRQSLMQQKEENQVLVADSKTDEPSCSINHLEDPTKEVIFHRNLKMETDSQKNIQTANGLKKNPMLKELNERVKKYK